MPCARANAPPRISRWASAPPRSRCSATSPTTPAASSTGTQSRKNLPAMPKPTNTWPASPPESSGTGQGRHSFANTLSYFGERTLTVAALIGAATVRERFPYEHPRYSYRSPSAGAILVAFHAGYSVECDQDRAGAILVAFHAGYSVARKLT